MYQALFYGGPVDGAEQMIDRVYGFLTVPQFEVPVAYRPDPVTSVSMVEYAEHMYFLKDEREGVCRYVSSDVIGNQYVI